MLKKRIIYTVNYSPWSPYSGGGQRSTHSLAAMMAQRGHDVHVVYSKGFLEKIPIPEKLPYTVHWATLLQRKSRRESFLRPVSAYSVNSIVRPLVADSDLPVVVHTNGEEGHQLYKLKKHAHFLLITTPRYSSYPDRIRGWPDIPLLNKVYLFLTDWKHLCQASLLRTADHICPPSHWASGVVTRIFGLNPFRITTIHNGVPAHFMDLDRPDHAHEGPLLYFGRLSHDKGVDLIIDAFSQIQEFSPPLWIVGEGEELNRLKRQARKYSVQNRIVFVPWQNQSDLADIVCQASIVILPSRRENYSLSVLSAMGAGVPTISTRVGGTPEMIDDHVNGILVPSEQTDQLVAAISKLLKNRSFARLLGQNAREHIRSALTWEKSCEKTDELYERLLSGSRTTDPHIRESAPDQVVIR